MNDPQQRAECQREYLELLPLVSDYVDLYGVKTPQRIALIEHDRGQQVTYRTLSHATEAFAAKLLAIGLRRGDVVATSLPFTKEHVFLEYACFKLGMGPRRNCRQYWHMWISACQGHTGTPYGAQGRRIQG